MGHTRFMAWAHFGECGKSANKDSTAERRSFSLYKTYKYMKHNTTICGPI